MVASKRRRRDYLLHGKRSLHRVGACRFTAALLLACCWMQRLSSTTPFNLPTVQAFSVTRYTVVPECKQQQQHGGGRIRELQQLQSQRRTTTSASCGRSPQPVRTLWRALRMTERDNDDDGDTKLTKNQIHRYLNSIQQLGTILSVYILDLLLLNRRHTVWPWEIAGGCPSVPWNGAVGFAVAVAWLRKKKNKVDNTNESILCSSTQQQQRSYSKISFLVATTLLVMLYGRTAQISFFWDSILRSQRTGSSFIVPTIYQLPLNILLGHLSWVLAGVLILTMTVPSFFTTRRWWTWGAAQRQNDSQDSSSSPSTLPTTDQAWNWGQHVAGGYLFSTTVFHIASWINRATVLPFTNLLASPSVVDQLIVPHHRAATLLGFVAPCLTAPVWEEVLYRAFLATGLALWTGSKAAALMIQAVIFSAHHQSLAGFIPLAALGGCWGFLYMFVSRYSLGVTVTIHALWNMRVFWMAWLGL